MLGSLCLKAMRILMFQLSGFYCTSRPKCANFLAGPRRPEAGAVDKCCPWRPEAQSAGKRSCRNTGILLVLDVLRNFSVNF